MKKEKENIRVTRAELSRELNVSKAYITKLVKKGVLCFDDNLDKKIDFNLAKKNIEDSSDPSKDYKKKDSSHISSVVNDKVSIVNDIKNPSESTVNSAVVNSTLEEFEQAVKEMNFNEARTASEQLKVIKQKIEIDKERGLLVAKDDVKRNAVEIGKNLQKSLFNITVKVAPVLANETDIIKIKTLLNSEIRLVLNNIMRELKK